ncbi:MAG: WYL domain-containing protein [Clostridiales bacterium]|nr:WYL domain-containing protein [Clostridiales bacterium]
MTVRPYKIASSPLLQYHYLVALPADAKTDKDILVLRVSRIIESKKFSRTSHITAQEQKNIDEVIRTKGIQYIVSQDSEIKVVLTDQGYKLYKSIIYLRPKHTDITHKGDKWVLTFMCAEEQIKNYFFQFGKEAMVISPDHLKQWFLDKYTDAVNSYQ